MSSSFTGRKSVWMLACTATVMLYANRAEARRGFVLITYGDKISEIGPVVDKDSLPDEMRGHKPMVVYYYQSFGVFWVDLWTWDGAFFLYNAAEESGMEIPLALAALLTGKPPDEVGVPFLYRFPPGLLLLAFFLLAGIANIIINTAPVLFEREKKKKKRKKPRVNEGVVVTPPARAVKVGASTFTPSRGSAPTKPPREAAPKRTASKGKAVGARPKSASESDVAELLRDANNREATKRLLEFSSKQSGVTEVGIPNKVNLKVGVDFLADKGVDRDEAKAILMKVVPAVLKAKRRRHTGGV